MLKKQSKYNAYKSIYKISYFSKVIFKINTKCSLIIHYSISINKPCKVHGLFIIHFLLYTKKATEYKVYINITSISVAFLILTNQPNRVSIIEAQVVLLFH